MLGSARARQVRSISAPVATRPTINVPTSLSTSQPTLASDSPLPKDDECILTLTSLEKDENLCAWNYDAFLKDQGVCRKQTNKKYDPLKSPVVGLNVKKSQFFIQNNKQKLGKLTGQCKEQNIDNVCSFVHYTDSKQYVEEYRKLKLLRMQRHHETESEETQCINNIEANSYDRLSNCSYNSKTNTYEGRRTYPVMCLQSYGNLHNANVSYGYRLDSTKPKENVKSCVKDFSAQQRRDMLSCVKIRSGVKCIDLDENDQPHSNANLAVSSSHKAVNICNLYPYESVTSDKVHIRNRELLQPESSLQCKKISDQLHSDAHKCQNWKPPPPPLIKGVKVHSAEDGRKVNKITPMVRSNEYCHIIKRVLGQYDNSKRTHRSTKEAETNFSYLLTSS